MPDKCKVPRHPRERSTMAAEALDDSDPFLIEVCWHYYVNGMTQAQVASLLGASRLRVNQAIQKAKARGMVKVQIESPFLSRVELQESLRTALRIPKVLVAPARRDAYDYHVPTGAALADHLLERLRTRPWKTIGVSWGMTLQSAIDRLPRLAYSELEVVSMIGGTNTGASFNAFGIASGFAERFSASYSLLAAPIFLSEGVDRDVFLAQASFEAHFRKCERLDVAVLVAGDISPRSYLISTGLPREIVPDDLRAAGAVGDLLGRFLDADGVDIDLALDARTIGVDLDMLARIPEKILAAAGSHKVPIIRAIARRGLIDTLVTDDVTAELLLAGNDPPGPSADRRPADQGARLRVPR
jgi:DNA-binding transcriptional regulator LsrR (DeoR family)